MNPDGWTAGDESDYQQELSNLKARLIAPRGDPEGEVQAVYMMLSDLDHGRQEYLKAKADGWL